MAAFLFMLLLLSVGRDVDSKPRHNTNGDDPYETINKKCISQDKVTMVVNRCTRGLLQLLEQGFPWLPFSPETTKRRKSNRSFQRCCERNNTRPADSKGRVSDPMDSLNHVCELFERISSCMDDHKTPVPCIPLGADVFFAYKAFRVFMPEPNQKRELVPLPEMSP